MKKGGYGKGRKEDDPLTKISKSLSYLLRHGAQSEGVPIRADGYVKVSDAIQWKSLKNVKFEQIKEVVENNDKKRYELLQLEVDGVKDWYIRAVQGHTIQDIQDDLLLEKIEDSSLYPVVVHGTYEKFWDLIKQSGLKTMARNHIHFAIGMPGQLEVISGMRNTCQIFIEIDLRKAMDDGIIFYISKNKVILSSGFDRLVPTKYFKRVVDKQGNVIFGEQQQQQQQQLQQQ